jgi:protoheme IX farnesyltransferase
VVAVLLGAWFLVEAHLLRRRSAGSTAGDQVGAMRVFHVSITYLTLLFVAVGLDPFVRF